MMTVEKKMAALKKAIGGKEKLAIGFSGGVDSSFLAKVAFEAMGMNALAITIDSELMPRNELAQAEKVAKLIGIRHSVVKCHPLQDKRFTANSMNRCYHCKKDDISAITIEAKRNGINCIAFGATISDLSEYRPGIKACEELNIWQPLLELRFTKEEVRNEANKMMLPVWNKPATACLASRITTGQRITRKKLKMIEEAEDFLHELHFEQVRVRLSGLNARIEVMPPDFKKVVKEARSITTALKKIGFTFVILDLEGYRPGGANIIKTL